MDFSDPQFLLSISLIVWAGAALLGRIAGGAIVTDPSIAGRLASIPHPERLAGGVAAALVVASALILARTRGAPERPLHV